MVVVGFDFGNAACYIAVAKEGGIEVLTNDYSLHATPSCVSFGQKCRSMGVSSRQQLNMNFKNTVINFKHLIGRHYPASMAQQFMKFVPCSVIQLADNQIGFRVNYLNLERVFSPVQIAACLLYKLKQLTENSMGLAISDCVFSVPYFVTLEQRSSYLAAAKVAGLDKVKIINDHAAIGIAYGIYKGSSLPPQDQKPKIVVFLDAGHSCVQASVMAFNERKVVVHGAAHDSTVGGLFLDEVIREHFHKEFLAKYKVDAAKNPRAWQRLLDECEKLRKQMSANKNPIPLAIECFMDGVDVSGVMDRAKFEELADPLFQKVVGVLKQLFEIKNEIKVEDVVEIELIGGCTRIPKIRALIKDFFNGLDPMTTMNLDDAVARGCALQAALISPVVIMKEFHMQDIYDTEEVKLPESDELVEWIRIEKEMEEVDHMEKSTADTRNALEEYVYKVRDKVETDQKERLNMDEKQTALDHCDRTLNWLDDNDEALKAEYETRHKEMATVCDPLLAKITRPPPMAKGFFGKKDKDANAAAAAENAKEDGPAAEGDPKNDVTAAAEGNGEKMDTNGPPTAAASDGH